MAKPFLLGLAGFLVLASTVFGQVPELDVLPQDIKIVTPWIMSSLQTRDYAAVARAKDEVLKLVGDRKLVPGELVKFSYGWNLNAALKSDPSKVMQQGYLRANVFKLVGGDGHKTAELQLPNSTQVVVISRPQQVNAPLHSLVSLAVPKSIVGMSKEAVQNRLSTPNKVEKSEDGREQWVFHHQITERAYTTEKSNFSTTGIIGNDVVALNTTQTTPVALNRVLVLWDFKLVIDDKGNVAQVEQGEIGATEWKRADAP